MKKIGLITLSVFLLVCLIIAGCSNTGSSSSDQIELSFWYGWTGPEAEALETLIAKWNEQHPEIQVTGLSQSDYQKQLTAITGGNPPDLASQFGQNVVPWGTRGAMMPLDDYIQKDNYDLSDFIPAALAPSQSDGTTYAIPIAMHVSMLFYNKDILSEAGFDRPPETLSELREYATALSIQSDDGRLERLGLWPGLDVYTLAYAYGGSFYDENTGEVTPDHPAVIRAIEFSKGIWDQYGSENLDRFASGLGQYMSPQNPFFSGKYAMTIDGEWLPTFIKQFAPDLNYGIAPIPYDETKPELKNPGNVTTSVFYIPDGAKHPDASWEFLKWITAPEQMAEFTAAIGNLPTRTSALENPVYNDVPGFKEFLDYSKSPNLRSFPAVPFANEYMTVFGEQHDAMLRGEVSIDEGLQKVKDEIQPLVK